MGNEVVNRKYVHTGRCHPETVVRWFLDTVHYWFDESLGPNLFRPNLFTGMRDDAEKYLSTWVETGEFPPDETTLEIHTRMKFEEWLASSWRTWTPSASIPSPLIPEQTAVRAQQLFDQWLKESGLSGWLNPDFGGWKTLIDRIASELRTVTPSPSVPAGNDSAWPLRDVLNTLIKWADHLRNSHNCDCHGYEVLLAAIDAAKPYTVVAPSVQSTARKVAEKIASAIDIFEVPEWSQDMVEQVATIISAELAARTEPSEKS